MRIMWKAAQAAACLAVIAAGSMHRAQAEPTPEAKPDQPAQKVRTLDRTLLSINLPTINFNDKVGFAGVGLNVNHTTDRGWYARVAHSNPRSPAASEGIAVVGSGGDNEVWGYELETGKRRWMARSDDSGISSIVISGDSAYFTTYSCTLERVQVSNGTHKFRKWISSTVECAPEVSGNTAFASYRGGKSHLISAHNISGGSENWKAEAPGNVIYAPVASGNNLFVATTDGRLASFEAGTGKQSWSREAGAIGAPVASEFGLLVVTANSTEAAAPAIKPATPEVSGAAPAPSVDRKDDRKTESTPLPKAPEQAVTTPNGVGVTLAAVGDRRLALLGTGSAPAGGTGVRLSGPTGYGMDYSGTRPGVNGSLCVIAMGNRVIALDLSTGAIKWELQVETKHGTFCQPAFGDNMVFLADNYGFVTAVERDSGNLVWSYKAEGHSFTGTPAISGNRVVLTTSRGVLLCLPTGTKQAKRDNKPADAFKKAVVVSGGVKAANDVPDPRAKAPTAKASEPQATPIEPENPGPAPTYTEPAPPPATQDDPYEGLPEDKRVGPGGIVPPKAGPGGIAPKEDPPSALPNPFEKKR